MSGQDDLFEASAAAVGYLFQLRQALSFCVEQLATGLDWSVAIEAGDDIEVRRDDITSLWQLKHRAPGTKLTDAATNLWKSLRIWATALPTWDTEYERPAFCWRGSRSLTRHRTSTRRLHYSTAVLSWLLVMTRRMPSYSDWTVGLSNV